MPCNSVTISQSKRALYRPQAKAIEKEYIVKIYKMVGIYNYSYTIDLYHTAAILSPRRTKTFVVARLASHGMRG